MCIDFYPATRHDIDNGNFPLTHDCILKVIYIQSSPLRFEYFTCQSQDTARLMDVICKLGMVRNVKVVSVDELPDIW